MTSDLCGDGGDKQREKETPAASKASSMSPLSDVTSLELPGPWNSPPSPVTPQNLLNALTDQFYFYALICDVLSIDHDQCLSFSSHEELEGSHLPLRPPPGLSHSFRSQLTTNDNMTDWLRLLLEADEARGEVKGPVLP